MLYDKSIKKFQKGYEKFLELNPQFRKLTNPLLDELKAILIVTTHQGVRLHMIGSRPINGLQEQLIKKAFARYGVSNPFDEDNL